MAERCALAFLFGGIIKSQCSHLQEFKDGANDEGRTRDLLITNQLLYQLSYIGVYSVLVVIFGIKIGLLYPWIVSSGK